MVSTKEFNNRTFSTIPVDAPVAPALLATFALQPNSRIFALHHLRVTAYTFFRPFNAQLPQQQNAPTLTPRVVVDGRMAEMIGLLGTSMLKDMKNFYSTNYMIYTNMVTIFIT
jgi:hypothetical protein